MQVEADSARVKVPPPLIYLGALLLGLFLDWLLDIPFFAIDSPARNGIAGFLFVAGFGIIVTGALRFRRHGTNVEPWRSSTTIVSDGIYRWTRNPMYLGMALIHAGLAIGLESLAALLLLPVVLIVIRTQVIAREERYLEAKFGDDYRRYKQRVRRWI